MNWNMLVTKKIKEDLIKRDKEFSQEDLIFKDNDNIL